MFRYLMIFIVAFSFLKAQDTVTVQAFTFDDISVRRGVWKFPDNPNEFRKILMSYTLKCDPKTPHDGYNCGEWDYLTYTTVHKHTGVMDSNFTSHAKYMIARTSPDTIHYSNVPQYKNYYIKKVKNELNSSDSERIFSNLDSNDVAVEIENGYTRFQFLMDRNTLKASYLENTVHRLKLKSSLTEGTVINNVIIRGVMSSYDDFTKFGDDEFTTLYDNNLVVGENGILDFVFNEEINFNPIRGILFDVAIDYIGAGPFYIEGNSDEMLVVAKNVDKNGLKDYYMQFDGTNDFITTDINDELTNVQHLSFEGWFRIDEWKSWMHLIGREEREGIILGNNEGQIYCALRSNANTTGNVQYAVQVGKWFHLAMVYDGTQEKNSDKLKLYVDGQKKSLSFNGEIPSETETNDLSFVISSLRNNTSALNGAADNIRVWKKSLSEEEIQNRMFMDDLSEQHDIDDLLGNFYFNNSNDNDEEIETKYGCKLFGKPQATLKEATELIYNPGSYYTKPVVELIEYENPEFEETETFIPVQEKIEPVSIFEYDVADHAPFITDQMMVWLPGYQYNYDEAGNLTDSTYYEAENMLINEQIEYYEAPYEVVNNFEIGRFITPYGINLDLGPDGFEWMYDVTDYAPLLTGDVDLSAGNLQELIDLKFYFIKGTPPRKVEEITQIWGERASYLYKDLAGDTKLSAKEIQLNPNAREFKVKTRLTGHGHQSNTGDAPHCCEWRDNTHYFYVNGEEIADWKIWRSVECGENPVYPQGGTWPGAREGWCPGDIVWDYEYEITDLIEGNSVTLDYDITDVPLNNQGMGKGNYIVAMHLIQYGESTNNNDAEIYEVMAPNNSQRYSRKNPICLDPYLKVRNNGTSDIKSLKIAYGVSGGETFEYNWSGTIKPNEIEEISIPNENSSFWVGDGKNIFTVELLEVDGSKDEYAENDIFHTEFNMPDLYDGPVVIVYKTNLRANNFSYEIFNSKGNYLTSLNPSANNKVYRDTIEQAHECVTFNLIDQYSYGLSYWAFPNQGDGYVRFEDINGKILKTFNPDFGRGLFYSFRTGDASYVKDEHYEYLVNVYPNPAEDNITVSPTLELGNTNIIIYNLTGKKVAEVDKYISEGSQFDLNVKNLTTGDYFIEFNNGKYKFTKRFLKK